MYLARLKRVRAEVARDETGGQGAIKPRPEDGDLIGLSLDSRGGEFKEGHDLNFSGL